MEFAGDTVRHIIDELHETREDLSSNDVNHLDKCIQEMQEVIRKTSSVFL